MLAYFLVFLGAILRVIPHPANFAAVTAISLFGAVYIKDKRVALVLPVAAMVISDFFIGFDSLSSRAAVYGCFLVTGMVGLWIRNHKHVLTIIGGSIFGSVFFYLVTNLVWLYEPTMYPHTIAGQISSYTNALPFFRNTLLGDLFYVGIFFGAYELIWLYGSKYKLVPQVSESKK